jgi:hypothetical protein
MHRFLVGCALQHAEVVPQGDWPENALLALNGRNDKRNAPEWMCMRIAIRPEGMAGQPVPEGRLWYFPMDPDYPVVKLQGTFQCRPWASKIRMFRIGYELPSSDHVAYNQFIPPCGSFWGPNGIPTRTWRTDEERVQQEALEEALLEIPLLRPAVGEGWGPGSGSGWGLREEGINSPDHRRKRARSEEAAEQQESDLYRPHEWIPRDELPYGGIFDHPREIILTETSTVPENQLLVDELRSDVVNLQRHYHQLFRVACTQRRLQLFDLVMNDVFASFQYREIGLNNIHDAALRASVMESVQRFQREWVVFPRLFRSAQAALTVTERDIVFMMQSARAESEAASPFDPGFNFRL